MVVDYAIGRDSEVLELSAEVGDALNVLAAVNERLRRRITQKWIFVDPLLADNAKTLGWRAGRRG